MTARPDKDGLCHINLGFAPSTGRQAVDDCKLFKELLREKLEQRDPDGVWLETVYADPHRGMQVTYDPEIAGAEAWAKKAEKAAPGVWAEMNKKSKERLRT